MKKWLVVWTVLLLLFGCETKAPKKDVIYVVATTGQIADLVEHVGGEYVHVEALMGPGVDPHLYKATQGDIQKLSQADIIFYNGLHLEGKLGEIFTKMSKTKKVVAVSETIPKEKLIEIDGVYDPHIWFDLDLWRYATQKVRDELSAVDPKHKQIYQKRAEAYESQLMQLKEEAKKEMNAIPKKQRVLITAHDAFHYFGRAYDIEVVGLQGLSTDAEYGLKDIQELVDMIVDRNIQAVFVESSVSKKAIEAVVEGAKQRGHHVSIGGELFSDALGKKGTEEGTFIGMYRYNVKTIAQALKGEGR
ncbi:MULTISPECIES: metal ABC transporter solute-binding protein, Zn/Mn family [Anoxybacillus]|uniref:ABC transporter permease protein n=1 Tax=Anoxybacillus flavithermus TaxID=33934 RepID=A0A178TQP6_9BACL|nr:zinc ABC transporter substrate-binding protein [Anoxybacillus flavithermus]ASA95827.1 manganese transporter [Anoxybacillus flavithermus]ELK22053.1 Mn2+ ABC transporter, substrate-binding protein/surface adhesin [Anoxybacillus flavithermus TNO-09.006]MBE2906034.1 zinc ABC transporter solute-binding protein [Anoxybacillus flavithermus]MBE2908627.1 zinc ABC transporter solute-binding protein [Anoxybacillus flavithermus]MBE2911301.1 zinc ABC transporter solute-binding protein [Anoxybacillus fla